MAVIATCPEHHLSYSGARHGTLWFHQDIGPALDSLVILRQFKIPVEKIDFDTICGRYFLSFRIPRFITVEFEQT